MSKPIPKNSKNIVGVGIIHHKKIEKQREDWKREENLYLESAKKYSIVSPAESRSRPLIIHYMRNMTMGGTEKMCQLLLKYMNHDLFEHWVASIGYEDNPRKKFFEEIVGKNQVISIAAAPEFSYILRELKPSILERYSAGIPEWPFTEANRSLVSHFISTSIFSQVDNTVNISATVFVSEYNRWLAQAQKDDNCYVVNNPVEEISTEGSSLREELGIPLDAFVVGRIGRPSDDIFDPIALKAFSKVARKCENLYFLIVAPPPAAIQLIKDSSITRVKFVDPTINEERINAFYRTIDVMAHSRKDGECNSAAMFEAMSCYKPIITHYSRMFNGQVDTVQNGGWTVLRDDVDEYARILEDCVMGRFDLSWYGKNSHRQWERIAEPRQQARKKERVYERVINK